MSKLSRKKKKTVFYNQGTNQSKWEISHASWLLLLLLTALLSHDLPPMQACWQWVMRWWRMRMWWGWTPTFTGEGLLSSLVGCVQWLNSLAVVLIRCSEALRAIEFQYATLLLHITYSLRIQIISASSYDNQFHGKQIPGSERCVAVMFQVHQVWEREHSSEDS